MSKEVANHCHVPHLLLSVPFRHYNFLKLLREYNVPAQIDSLHDYLYPEKLIKLM